DRSRRDVWVSGTDRRFAEPIPIVDGGWWNRNQDSGRCNPDGIQVWWCSGAGSPGPSSSAVGTTGTAGGVQRITFGGAAACPIFDGSERSSRGIAAAIHA